MKIVFLIPSCLSFTILLIFIYLFSSQNLLHANSLYKSQLASKATLAEELMTSINVSLFNNWDSSLQFITKELPIILSNQNEILLFFSTFKEKASLNSEDWINNLPHEKEFQLPLLKILESIQKQDKEGILSAYKIMQERLDYRLAYKNLRANREGSSQPLVLELRLDKANELTLEDIELELIFRKNKKQTNSRTQEFKAKNDHYKIISLEPTSNGNIKLTVSVDLNKIFKTGSDIYKHQTIAQIKIKNKSPWFSTKPKNRKEEDQSLGKLVVIPQTYQDPDPIGILETYLRRFTLEQRKIISTKVMSILKSKYDMNLDDATEAHATEGLEVILRAIHKTGATIASEDGLPNYPYLYNWQRDSWKSIDAILWLYSLTEVPELLSIVTEHLNFVANSDLPKDPGAQRISTLGYSLHNEGSKGYKITQHAPQNNEDPSWGNQDDSPAHALRTIINYVEVQPAHLQQQVAQELLPIVSTYLNYLNQRVNKKLIADDLWEEIGALHFYTTALQIDVLWSIENSLFWNFLSKKQQTQTLDATKQITKYFSKSDQEESFIDPKTKRLKAHIHYNDETARKLAETKPDNLDASILGAFKHMSQASAIRLIKLIGIEPILQTFLDLDQAFINEYPINQTNEVNAILWGRYKDDIYNGDPYSVFIFTKAHPWFITTFWRLQFLEIIGNIYETESENKEIWEMFFNNLSKYSQVDLPEKTEAKKLLANVIKKDMDYLNSLVSEPGAFAEQADRYNGNPRGVRPLTWSLLEYLKTMMLDSKQMTTQDQTIHLEAA